MAEPYVRPEYRGNATAITGCGLPDHTRPTGHAASCPGSRGRDDNLPAEWDGLTPAEVHARTRPAVAALRSFMEAIRP